MKTVVLQNLNMKEFFADFWAMILERFQADFGVYENLNVSERTLETIRVAVIAFFSAIMVAAVVICVKRWMFGSLVHRLEKENCTSPETAKTLEELGLRKNFFVKAALRLGGQYRGLVRCTEEDTYDEKMEKMRAQNAEDYAEGRAKNPYAKKSAFVYDFSLHHFYIPEESSIKASRFFERRGTSLPGLIAILLVSFIAMLALIYFLPDIVQFFDNFAGIIKSNG